MPKKVTDLMRVTGRGRPAVIRAIEKGQLPGYRMGDGETYSIPDEAFELFCKGYWQPDHSHDRPLLPIKPLIHRRTEPA